MVTATKVAAACAVALPAAAQPHLDGVWSQVHGWPLIPVHAVMTPEGRVLSYGTKGDGTQTGFFIYDLWDPSVGPSGGHTTLDNRTATDIFCSSQVIMPQTGDILIAGGDNWTGTGTTNTGNNNSNVFDSDGNTLTRSAVNMNRARWYSSSTVLVNGDIYIQGGSGGGDFPEVRQQNGSFRLLSTAGTSGYDTSFPRNFLAPDGRVFGYDTAGRMYYVNAGGTGSLTPQGQLPSANAGWTSGAAMFRPGKILQMGGNSNAATVIDINGPVPIATPTQSMSTKRMWVSATVLPDGKVLATGGSEVENQLTGVNNRAEIWNPATGTWRLGTAGARARLYHSGALLLPDATVLVSGGGAPGPQVNTNAEIYYPPYLFDASGSFAIRPRITSWPSTAEAGDALTLEVEGDVTRVTLAKTGSTTHSVNMDQRFVELPVTRSGTTVSAQLPARATDAPPGFYMMFAVDSAGVPSTAKMLRINIDATPNTAVDFTPTMGGNGGSAFNLACAVDEVLVGVHGRFGTSFVNQVGPQCIRVDQFGRWIGDPVKRPVTGTTTTGTLFDKVCARDWAVSGFRGSSGTQVNQIELQCRALTPSGGLTGTGTFLGSSGGTGGTAQALQTCGTGNPGYALYGRSGSVLDSFGMVCRQGAITPISTNETPVIVNPGTQTWVAGEPVSLQITATDGDSDPLTYSASALPAGLAIGMGTGLIGGTPTAPGTGQATITVSDGQETDSTTFNWSVTGSAPLSVQPMPPQLSRLAGSDVTYTAATNGGVNVRYKWQFGDGTPETALSESPSVTHAYTAPGIYFVTLTVTDDVVAAPLIQQFVQTIHLPLTTAAARWSSNLAYETRSGSNSRLWVVNQDNDSVSVFDAVTNTRLAEIAVGEAPRSVAIAGDGRIWVVNHRGGTISIVSPASLSVDQTLSLPFGSQPYGIVFSPTANRALVALAGSGALLALDGTTGAQLGMVAVGPNPRHVAIDGAGTNAYVSRFVTLPQAGEGTAVVDTQASGADVVVVDANDMVLRPTIMLAHSTKADAENQGSGVPNYLGAVAISPDGRAGYVPSKQDNIARGMLRSGENLSFQNTVRAISSRLDLVGNVEDLARRIDHDDSGVASAAAYDRYGVYLFVALETSREVAVVDAHNAAELFRIDTGRAPQGLVLSPDGRKLFVNNFMDRTVDVYDLSSLQDTGQWAAPRLASRASITTERLAANVLLGKQLFYDARDTRLARDGYMSCASCHNDGGADGRTWDITGMGEGLRNTISLRGPASAHGRAHWSSNFDEVQDFEGQIRSLAGGTGLMTDAAFNEGTRSQPLGDPKAGFSADLDALAAYVASLNQFAASPHRTSAGELTTEAQAGRAVFKQQNCASCHSGAAFTDSSTNTLHDIGTLKPTSGQRLGTPLTGLDTPTLRGVWQTGPYLHDGSAPTIAAAISAHSGLELSAADLNAVAAYVAQTDGSETTAPVNAAPVVTRPSNQTSIVGRSVNLPIIASDADGDVLTYAASNLPAGLAINASTGVISGTPTAAGTRTVTVTVSDYRASTSTTFSFAVSADTSAPSKPGTPTITLVSGKPHLTWPASTDNVGVTGYIIYRSTKSSSPGTEVGRSATTTFTDTSATSRTWYYSIRAYDAAGNVSNRSNVRSVRVP
ncbi:MAG TPA: putative Ig domain-containing protein [Gammaproteobacteria bacterium]|nr:putative Ig domain-containing protein [Gammaproteobacteria bacterium]